MTQARKIVRYPHRLSGLDYISGSQSFFKTD